MQDTILVACNGLTVNDFPLFFLTSWKPPLCIFTDIYFRCVRYDNMELFYILT